MQECSQKCARFWQDSKGCSARFCVARGPCGKLRCALRRRAESSRRRELASERALCLTRKSRKGRTPQPAKPRQSCKPRQPCKPTTPANHATLAKPRHTTPECRKLVVLRTILPCNKARTRSSSAPLKPIMRRTKLSTSTEQSPARQEQQPLARLPRCRLHPGAHRHGGSCGARRCRSNALPSLGQARPHGGTAPRA